MPFRKVSMLAASGLLALSLAACSGSSEEAPPEGSPENTVSAGNTAQPEQTEAEAQEEIRDKWNIYTDSRLEAPEEMESLFLPYGDNEVTAAEIVEQAENDENSTLDLIYFDEDFTTNEKAVTLAAEKSGSQYGSIMRLFLEDGDVIEADLDPDKILIRDDKAFVKTDALIMFLNGEEVPMDNVEEDINSIWVRKDGEWLMDARAQLDIILLAFWAQTGGEETTPESVLELMRVIPS